MRPLIWLAVFATLTAFFAVTKSIEAKAVMREAGAWPCVRVTLLFAACCLPIMPFLYWALRTIYLASGERLWAVAIVMMAWAHVASAVVFWYAKGEVPTGGTLVGLVLASAAVAAPLVWK